MYEMNMRVFFFIKDVLNGNLLDRRYGFIADRL